MLTGHILASLQYLETDRFIESFPETFLLWSFLFHSHLMDFKSGNRNSNLISSLTFKLFLLLHGINFLLLWGLYQLQYTHLIVIQVLLDYFFCITNTLLTTHCFLLLVIFGAFSLSFSSLENMKKPLDSCASCHPFHTSPLSRACVLVDTSYTLLSFYILLSLRKIVGGWLRFINRENKKKCWGYKIPSLKILHTKIKCVCVGVWK